jgi:hypothetical protein
MKVNAVKSGLLAVALVALASGSAWANTITPSVTGWVPGVSITYDADLTSGEIHAGDGFTIFDIGGFTGFGALPAGWVASFSAGGSPFSPPASLGPDSVDTNVHFTYMGAPFEVAIGSFIYTPFVVLTTSTTLVTDDWLSRDHSVGTPFVIDGAPATAHRDDILVPAHVPDGGSTAMLLGSVLVAFGALRRKFNG